MGVVHDEEGKEADPRRVLEKLLGEAEPFHANTDHDVDDDQGENRSEEHQEGDEHERLARFVHLLVEI